MPSSAPALDRRLRKAARALDNRKEPMAETWRRVGRKAACLGVPRPSYETIRLIVREHRRLQLEVRELLQPVLSDLLQGRVSAYDVQRVIEAAQASKR